MCLVLYWYVCVWVFVYCACMWDVFFFFKQKTAYEMRISDWSSDVCSSDLDERKALLVAGAAGGMAATFNAPLASILLAVELLLFEWKPRSYLPVAAAVLVATLVRGLLMGTGAIFPVPDPGIQLSLGDRKSTRLNSSH